MSPYLIDFSHRHSYVMEEAITLPITLISGDDFADVSAKLDTGSKFCVFNPRYADLLSIDLTSGIPRKLSTATGSFYAYGHDLTLSIFDFEWQTFIYFAESESFPVNVLGRVGFLDHIRIALVDYEETLYANLYDQE